MTLGQKQNNIDDLPDLESVRYENIFNVYTETLDADNVYYYYNIMNKVSIDDTNIDPDVFEYFIVQKPFPWTTISHIIYKTQYLWWLILATNKIINPITQPSAGTVLKVIKPEFVTSVINEIQQSINT